MITKSWKFKGFDSEMPEWVQEETSKRLGSPDLGSTHSVVKSQRR